MKKLFLLISSLIITLFLSACTTTDESNTSGINNVSGIVLYKERIALPSEALITVTLEDTSIADKSATILATDSFMSGGKQVPFKFNLDFDPSKIDERHTYTVRAKITLNGKLYFTTDTATRVITDNNKTTLVNLVLTRVN